MSNKLRHDVFLKSLDERDQLRIILVEGKLHETASHQQIIDAFNRELNGMSVNFLFVALLGYEHNEFLWETQEKSKASLPKNKPALKLIERKVA